MLKARFAARLALLAIVSCLSLPARAQCLDFASGFGVPGQGVNGEVKSMVAFDDGSGSKLYAVGQFTTAGGVAASNAAVWNGTNWSALASGFNATAESICVFDDGTGPALYVGGDFSASGATALGFVAKWSGSAWTALAGGANNFVNALAVFDDGTGNALYATGSFTQIGGGAANRVAKWNGTSWSAVGTGLTRASGTCYGNFLARIDDGTTTYLAIGGLFDAAGGAAAPSFTRWTGSAFSSLSPAPPGGTTTRLVMHDDGSGAKLYAALTTAGGGRVSRLQGGTWTTLGNFTQGTVATLLSSSDALGPALFVGGSFRSAQPGNGRGVMKHQSGAWAPLGGGTESGVDDRVWAFARFGADVFVGGPFDVAGGYASRGIARWGNTCVQPSITQQPADLTARFPSNAVLTVAASGTAPLAYQWRRNGVSLVNTPQHILGATTSQLTVVAWSFHDAGVYDCVVTNSLGSATSNAAVFTVPAGGFTNTPVQLTKIFGAHEPVPGVPGALFDWMNTGVVREDGSILSTGIFTSGGNALCQWDAGVNSVVLGTGSAAPGTAAGVTFQGSLTRVGTRDDGQVVLSANLTGPGVTDTNRSGIWRSDSAGTYLVARLGEASPDGVPGNTTNRLFTSSFAPSISANGAVAYFDNAKTSGGVTLPTTLRFAYAGGARDEVFRVGGPAPGTSSTFTRIDDPQFVGSSDTVACSGLLASGATGVWIGVPGGMSLALSSTDPAPGYPAGTTLNELRLQNVNTVTDVCLVSASPREPNGTQHRALYMWSPTALRMVASDLSLSPPLNAFWAFTVYAVTSSGDVLFTADHTGDCGTCPWQSIYLKDSTGLHFIAGNRGTPLPEVASQLAYDRYRGGALNERGEVVFYVALSGELYNAAFGWTQAAGVFPIAVPGTQMEIASGQYKTVNDALLAPETLTNSADTWMPLGVLNDAGTLAFSVAFLDADRASYVGQFEHLASLYVLAPVVVAEPESVRVQPGQDAELSAVVIGQQPLAYQWRKDGVDVIDDATYSGAQTASLRVAGASDLDVGAYTLFVSNAHGTVETAPGVLTVAPGDVFCAGDGALADHTTDCPCGNHGDPGHGCAHSFDARGARLVSHGTTTLDDAVLHAEFLPSNAFTLFLQHDAAGDGAFHDGVLCASGNLVRLRGRAASGGESFFPNTSFLNDSLTLSQRGGVFPGQAVNRYYSAWYRNASTTFCPPAAANVTNGVRVLW